MATTKSTNRDPRVDAYIAKAADFAKPILMHLREIVHEGCPNVQETIKWGMPSFEYKGILCGIASFKNHATFGFWKHALVVGSNGEAPAAAAKKSARSSAAARAKPTSDTPASKSAEAMGDFGRLTSLTDLPSKKLLLAYVKKAAKLNDEGIKIARPPRKPPVDLVVPPDLGAGLKKSAAARKHFDAFSYSKKKDYIEWLAEAKTEETRNKRLATALEWIAEGKARHWKYERC